MTCNDINISIFEPRVKMYTGWANYQNVKSGNYNRQPCWKCAEFRGFPQAPGVYDLNIVNEPIKERPPCLSSLYTESYQKARMSNHPGSYNSQYVNYLNNDCYKLYPKRYIKGFWPDERLSTF